MTLHLQQIILPLDAISDYCERWQIVEFALFVSVLRDDFSADSDIDVLVTFAEDFRYTLFTLEQMETELEAILGHVVDLIDRRAVEESPNYIRRNEILGTAQVIYGTQR